MNKLRKVSKLVNTSTKVSISSTSSNTTTMSAKEQQVHQFGWPISERIIPEVVAGKLDVWTVFSPQSGNDHFSSLNHSEISYFNLKILR